MNCLQEKNDALFMDNVRLADIAAQAGTPTYVYSAANIRGQYEALTKALCDHLPANRQPLICYACKANSHLAILSILQKCGSAIEAVSEGELRRAIKAGFAPEKIVSEGVGKTAEEIKLGLTHNIHQFNVESLGELRLISEIATSLGKTASVIFRVNPDIGGGANDQITTGRKQDKFGMPLARVMEAYQLAGTLSGIDAKGIHAHIGSQVSEAASFEALFSKLSAMTADIRHAGHKVSRIDIGGGFPIRYRDEKLLDLATYAQLVNKFIVPLETEIIIEPGRYFVGNSGILLAKILYTKRGEDRNFLILDAGMQTLVRPAMYGAWHDIQPVENLSRALQNYDIAGPICESADMFGRDYTLPEMRAGEIAVIKSAGAYGMCMASSYNSHLLPAEVLVNNGSFEIIRPRQSYDALFANEIIPATL